MISHGDRPVQTLLRSHCRNYMWRLRVSYIHTDGLFDCERLSRLHVLIENHKKKNSRNQNPSHRTVTQNPSPQPPSSSPLPPPLLPSSPLPPSADPCAGGGVGVPISSAADLPSPRSPMTNPSVLRSPRQIGPPCGRRRRSHPSHNRCRQIRAPLSLSWKGPARTRVRTTPSASCRQRDLHLLMQPEPACEAVISTLATGGGEEIEEWKGKDMRWSGKGRVRGDVEWELKGKRENKKE